MKWRLFLYQSIAFALALFACLRANAQDVRITEFLASNTRGLQDEDRVTSDWIEIHNAGSTNVNLLNWGLTDDRGRQFRWRFPATNINAGAYIIVFASSKDRKVPGLPLHTSFGLRASGGYLALSRPDGSIATVFDPYPAQAPDVSYGVGDYATNLTAVTANAAVRVRVPADDSDGTNWTLVAYDDSAWQAGTNGVGYAAAPFVRTDIQGAMSNVNASARVRIPFTPSSSSAASMTLRVRYNDGFAAFLNGAPLIAGNAPDPLLFNSAATGTHSAATSEDYQLPASLLTSGPNVLAIQGLNVAADDPDFLIAAELILTYISEQPLYFSRPTPGLSNGGGAPYAGPAISDERHLPNVPTDSDDLQITARVRETLFPVTNVVLTYRVMFGNSNNVPMFDDGLHGDGAAGDGVYGATIPASVSTPSQMIRWRFRAWDNRGNISGWPLYSNPTNAAEYFGTMVDYTVVSKLPVIHLFAPPNVLSPGPITPDNTGADGPGGRVAVFYDGEFYDNVGMSGRGNTTLNYDKKSHRMEFNSEHLFRHSDEYPRIGNTSFVAEWPDPAYMRQGLCFWLGNLIGSPGSFYNPVRLQLNGVFYQLANHNDVQDEDLLERLGFDPNGALYNAAGQVRLPIQSTGRFEKKTRGWDIIPGTATAENPRGYGQDYVKLATGLAETNTMAQRRLNAYDLFDIPNAINYLVVARWAHENDDVWANMSLYHDNDGDDLWRIIGFDMNLSWGAIFHEGSLGPLIGDGVPGNVIATNDTHKAHPLYGSSTTLALAGPAGAWNRVYEVFFQNADLREMYLRRLRTVMDEYVKPPGLHPALYPMEKRVRELRDMMLPEAEMDRSFWGWAPKGSQCSFDPGIRLLAGSEDLINYFIARRRHHFYVTHSITNASGSFPVGTSKTQNAGIPLEQPFPSNLQVAHVEFNPSGGDQLHEYLTVTNPNPWAVDVSDWQLRGGVEFTFAKGTVIPSQSVVYVSPNIRAFKARPVAPRGGMGLFVVGPYRGQLSARGEPLVIHDHHRFQVYSNLYAGNPSAAQQHLRITEIMYNPTPMPEFPTTDAQEFEYVELKNISTSATLDLTGVKFVGGITFDFAGSSVTALAPGERVLVVKNIFAFEARYGTGLSVAGQYFGSLDNGGDRIQLVDSSNEEIHDFDYEDDWYPVTDGGGFSLAIVNDLADPGAWDSKLNWQASGQENGAPGQGETAPTTFAPVLINEVLSHTDLPMVDQIELYNPNATDVNIGGWFLTDDFSNAKKYRIAEGTGIPAGGYLVFDEDDFNPGGLGFGLSSTDDEVYIFSADANTNLTGYAHGFSFGAAANGVSFGRHTNSVGDIHFVAQRENSFPGVNAGPKIGPVIISEIMYRPQGGSSDEYIELQNISGSDVELFDSANPGNTWQLRGGVEFDFPSGATIPANGHVLIANFDVTNPFAMSAFRQKYNVPAAVAVFGPYRGELNNDEDEIELKRPEMIDEATVAYVMVEQVDYRIEEPCYEDDDDGPPCIQDPTAWPASADGTGASFQRMSSSTYANDRASWVAAAASAGRGRGAGSAPVITSHPANQSAIAFDSAMFSVGATGDAPLRYQWRFNGNVVPGGTNASLVLQNLQLEQTGRYSVSVYNDAGAATSSSALLTVRLGAFILSQPQPTSARENSNATFSVSVYTAEPPLSYQWQFNDIDIPGATGPTLDLESVQETDDGFYRVVITDGVGTITSQPARLTVLIPPTLLSPVPPLNLTVLTNESLTLSAQIRGTLPIFVRWRLTRAGGGTISLGDRFYDQPFATRTFTIGPNDSGRVLMSITNIAGGSLATSGVVTNAFLTVLADTDRDRIPDVYESANGMDPNDATDALEDLDGDTMSNRDEYIAGTDPQDVNSYLKIERLEGVGPATITFNAVSNRSYTVQSSDTLVTPAWSNVGDVVAHGTNRQGSVIDPGSNPERFYRLVTPAQP